jgi:hypothetical protein
MGYKMQIHVPVGSGERLDTMEGLNDLYDEEYDGPDGNYRLDD